MVQETISANDLLLISRRDLKQMLSETIEEKLNLSQFKPQKEESPERYLTRKETSDLLSICLATLNSWTKEGVIPAYRVGRFVRYKASDIDKALENIRSIKYSRYNK